MPRVSKQAYMDEGSRQPHLTAEHVLSILKYFAVFEYPLSMKQIHQFLPVRASLEDVDKVVSGLVRSERINKLKTDSGMDVYALGGHLDEGGDWIARASQTEKILRFNRWFIHMCAYMPCIDLVGISGSCSMHNAQVLDDCDVFIISAPGRIWTARLVALIIAKGLGKHRGYASVTEVSVAHRVCLNLFFDGNYLAVPQDRRSEYIAHEVVQMLPVMVRGGAYERFLKGNAWVLKVFPNLTLKALMGSGVHRESVTVMKRPSSNQAGMLKAVGDIIEKCARWIQLRVMHTPTQERISSEQLWFFPHDFEDVLSKNMPR